MRKGKIVEIDYTNWRGLRSIRTILPLEIFYGSPPFHKGYVGWFLKALDIEEGVERDFCLKDIHIWKGEDAPDLIPVAKQQECGNA